MPDSKANEATEAAAKESSLKAAGSKAETAPAPKNQEQAAAPKEVSPNGSVVAKDKPQVPPAKRVWNFKKIVPAVVLLLAAAIFVGIAGGWNALVGGRANQKTDDAYLRADITPLSTRVSGTVAQVAVADYQRVKAGDL